jgi:hypothetical protein
MQTLKLLFAVILVLGLSACPSTDISQSKFVKQSEICQTYTILADEITNAVDVTAFFRFGGTKGTTLVLNDSVGSMVRMDEDTLRLEQDGKGAHYSCSNVFYPGKKTFTFTDGDGKPYINAIGCEKFRVYNVPGKVSRNEVLELNFEGTQPSVTETLVCEYKDTSMAFGSDYIITEIGGNKIFIPPAVFQKMKNGPVTFQFLRRNYTATQSHGSLPGYLSYEYKGMIFKCTLTGKGNDFVKN